MQYDRPHDKLASGVLTYRDTQTKQQITISVSIICVAGLGNSEGNAYIVLYCQQCFQFTLHTDPRSLYNYLSINNIQCRAGKFEGKYVRH